MSQPPGRGLKKLSLYGKYDEEILVRTLRDRPGGCLKSIMWARSLFATGGRAPNPGCGLKQLVANFMFKAHTYSYVRLACRERASHARGLDRPIKTRE